MRLPKADSAVSLQRSQGGDDPKLDVVSGAFSPPSPSVSSPSPLAPSWHMVLRGTSPPPSPTTASRFQVSLTRPPSSQPSTTTVTPRPTPSSSRATTPNSAARKRVSFRPVTYVFGTYPNSEYDRLPVDVARLDFADMTELLKVKSLINKQQKLVLGGKSSESIRLDDDTLY